MVPGAGVEPARRNYPSRDFKSLVSTSFTTRAQVAGLCQKETGSGLPSVRLEAGVGYRRPRLCRLLDFVPEQIVTQRVVVVSGSYLLRRTYFFCSSPHVDNGEASRDASPSPGELARENSVTPPGPKGTGFETPNP